MAAKQTPKWYPRPLLPGCLVLAAMVYITGLGIITPDIAQALCKAWYDIRNART